MIVTAGKLNVTVDAYFVDDDGGTAPGEPTTGKLFSDIETGGSASYHRQGAARVDFTLVTQTVAGAHTDGGFIEIDATNMPGVYRLDVPDLAFATGVDYVVIMLKMAAANNSIMRPLMIDLTDVDLRDSVRGGMTALPNAAPDAAGGLPISDLGGLDLDGRLDVAVSSRLAPTVAARTIDVLATGEVPIDFDSSIGDLAAAQIEASALNGKGDWNIGKTGYALSTAGILAIWHQLTSAIVTAGTIGLQIKANLDAVLSARTLVAADYFDPAADTVANVTTVATTTTNTDMRGTDGALTDKAGFSLSTAGILAIWHQLTAAIVTASTIGKLIVDNLNATISSRMPTTHIDATAGAVDTVTANSDMRGTDSAALASVATEARLAELDAANLPADIDNILTDTGTTIPGTITTLQADTDNIQTRLPAALVGSRMNSDVANIQTGAIVNTDFAAGAIDAAALAADAVAEIADGLLDRANGIETGITPRQFMRLCGAALAGELTGAATTTITIKAVNNGGTTRVVATVDADGNRTSLTLTP